MTDKDLQRLKRVELLEILVEQGKTIEQLEKELEDTKKRLEERNLCIEEAGSIADAAIQLNGVFEAAQDAAYLYLENVQQIEQTTKQKCEALEKETEEKCQKMLEDAQKGVDEKWAEISARLEEFYDTHKGMREMLKMLGNFVKDVDAS